MIKLIDLIRELRDPASEEAQKTSYEFRAGSPRVKTIRLDEFFKQTHYDYYFENSKGAGMEISINIEEILEGANKEEAVKRHSGLKYAPAAYLSFGLDDSNAPDNDEDYDEEEYKWNTLTKGRDLFKIIATIDKAFKDAIKKHFGSDGDTKLKSIRFAPSDDRRKRIYEYYMTKFYKQFAYENTKGQFQTYMNKNYVNELYQFGDREEPPYSRFDTAREDVEQHGTLFKFVPKVRD